MSSRKKKRSSDVDELSYIRPLLAENAINRSDILALGRIEYPLFSFKYLKEESYTESRDCRFLSGVITRLHRLSEVGWDEIGTSHKHCFGIESIPKAEVKAKLPPIITPDIEKVHLLRDSGDNKVMIGLREGKIFHIFYICANFSDYYTHGNSK